MMKVVNKEEFNKVINETDIVIVAQLLNFSQKHDIIVPMNGIFVRKNIL